eukprot:TRINITY_DN7746_c0_g1_i1.p2 TRINITY_DN7746_c0_g1~~TRINITY_DN7746_c0_g1_i1.p2  ORF type:complete len:202 (+),score=62.95 TRINITY_DN7746_c0_g1_i1:79-684(+)
MPGLPHLPQRGSSMGALLADICDANAVWAVEHDEDEPLSAFDCDSPPPISVPDYMRQVERAAGARLWPSCLLLIDELTRAAQVPVSLVNVHRLLVTAYSVVLKLCADCTGVSKCVAEAGGVSTDDLVEMEMTFLELLDWRVNVSAAAQAMLADNFHIAQGLARLSAANSLDGPVVLIPEAAVPREVRFDLMALPMATTSAA